MDKEQAIYNFWSGFGLMAYDETIVPDSAQMPYITYSVATGSLDEVISMTASLWYRSTSWAAITKLKNQIAEYIGVGGKVIPIEGGYMWIVRGAPFAQRMSDEDGQVRRIYLQVQAEFLTAN